MLQYSIEALDREDFEVLVVALEGTTPSKRSIKSLSTDNNNNSNASPFSLANISANLEFACLL